MRIAVVEDNLALADGIARAFRNEGHGVDQLHDGKLASDFLRQEAVDLVILDINLPNMSGLDVLKEIRREKKNLPVLLLTARAGTDDKVQGLDWGADDYMTKPFELVELQARARALMRRGGNDMAEDVTCGDITFNLHTRQLSIAGTPVDLPRREGSLAELLVTRQGQVVSKQQIMDHLYGTGSDVEESAVELYVCRLRKRLSPSTVTIKTLRGLGYCLRQEA